MKRINLIVPVFFLTFVLSLSAAGGVMDTTIEPPPPPPAPTPTEPTMTNGVMDTTVADDADAGAVEVMTTILNVALSLL